MHADSVTKDSISIDSLAKDSLRTDTDTLRKEPLPADSLVADSLAYIRPSRVYCGGMPLQKKMAFTTAYATTPVVSGRPRRPTATVS